MLKFALVVVVVTIVGYLLWHRPLSQGARIEAAYNACMKDMDAASTKANAQAPKGNEPASSVTKAMGDTMVAMLQGMGGAMCGVMKDACTKDFDGQLCQTALRHYP